MMNQVLLVGRITTINEIGNTEKKEIRVTIAVNRNFKNADGVYETDFIDCVLYSYMASNLLEYCTKGDLIGARGRLRCKVEKNELEFVADRITFLSTKENLKDKEEYTSENEEEGE